MEKIYIVNDQLDSKIIGRNFPQANRSIDSNLQKEYMKKKKEDMFIKVPVEGYNILIQKGTKLTDYISSFLLPDMPILSARFIDLLRGFKFPPYQIIPINIYRDKDNTPIQNYSIVSFSGNDIDHINFPLSTFDYFTGGSTLDKSLLNFKSYEDYQSKIEKDDRIQMAIIQKVAMKTSLVHDLFFLGIFKSSAFFIRQQLKETLEKEKITGFRFEEIGYVAND